MLGRQKNWNSVYEAELVAQQEQQAQQPDMDREFDRELDLGFFMEEAGDDR